jgi:Protein of unknown function (DUF3102)
MSKGKDGSNTKRALDDIAVEIRALERSNAFDTGDLLIEAHDACEHGEWYAWLEREFAWSEDTADNYMRAARLAAKSRTVRDLKVPMRIIYDLADDIEDSDLPAIIEALAKASKSAKISVDEANEVVELTRLRIQFGDYPPATLFALDSLSDEGWAKQASEKLKEVRPTTDEEADRIIDSYRPPPEPEPEDEPEDEEEEIEPSGEPITVPAKPDDGKDQSSLQAEKARIVRAWCDASSGAKLEFVRERWDEISMARGQLDAIAQEVRWITGDDAR